MFLLSVTLEIIMMKLVASKIDLCILLFLHSTSIPPSWWADWLGRAQSLLQGNLFNWQSTYILHTITSIITEMMLSDVLLVTRQRKKCNNVILCNTIWYQTIPPYFYTYSTFWVYPLILGNCILKKIGLITQWGMIFDWCCTTNLATVMKHTSKNCTPNSDKDSNQK